MLTTATTLKGYQLDSLDGEIGKVKEFYFDDQHWAVRYLIADTGNWLTGRQVLISPHALVAVVADEEQIKVNLTKQQIEDSPPLETDKPVSRQFEEAHHRFRGWPMYWAGPYMWGAYPNVVHERMAPTQSPDVVPSQNWDAHLRSTDAVSGHHIEAPDGGIGHVEDFIIDDEMWAIRYLVVDTRNWWPGKKVLISPRWIERVSWDESRAYVNVFREAIRQAPEYTGLTSLTRDYEIALHRCCNCQGYWVDETAVMEQFR